MPFPLYLAFLFGSRRILHRADLRRGGMSGQDITEAVRRNDIIRVRRDHYARPDLDRHTLEAVRVGGRLACVSAAAELGLFVFDDSHTHLHLGREASRLRSPHNRFRPLAELPRNVVQLHWWPLIEVTDGTEFCVGVRDALVQRSEAGQETVLREMILDARLRCEIRVSIDGVGRVDLLVEGCVVVEADSQGFHKEWEQHVRTAPAMCSWPSAGICRCGCSTGTSCSSRKPFSRPSVGWSHSAAVPVRPTDPTPGIPAYAGRTNAAHNSCKISRRVPSAP
jgi:hypothetical protein